MADDERSEGQPSRVVYAAPRKLAELANKDVYESSGLAVSRRHPGLFWTHNDSGHEPRIYAFDATGRDRGVVDVLDAEAVDWEDMASFVVDGQSYLLLADVGDNARRRERYQLYIIEEPAPNARRVRVRNTIDFHFEDGPLDCEAVGVDPSTKTILLVSKILGARCRVYQLRLDMQKRKSRQTALAIGSLDLMLATAMDISPDGSRALVATYLDGYEYTRRDGESWKEAFARPARVIYLPQRVQGESVCYGADGRTIYLTSERLPTPLWELPVRESPDPPATDPGP